MTDSDESVPDGGNVMTSVVGRLKLQKLGFKL